MLLLLATVTPLPAAYSAAPATVIASTLRSSTIGATDEPRDGSGLPASSASSDIVVSAPLRPTATDPLERINFKSFSTMQSVDRGFVAPVAFGYRRIVPAPIRDGLHNLLANLDEPVIFLNFVAQHKIGKAGETAGRFTINSTIGIAGLFDVARKRPFHLPHRPNGFADTMGFYGIEPGPFMFLPIVGPTSLRDLSGGIVDRLVLPLGIGVPFDRLAFTVPAGVAKGLDHRLRFDGELQLQRTSDHPYASARSYYLARRQAEIDHLRHRDTPVSIIPER